MDVLHLVVDCQTSYYVWRTLEKALASLSNSRIIQPMDLFKIFGKEILQLLHTCSTPKSLFDELAAIGRPLSLEDFNLYIFYGIRNEFKDLVTCVVTKAELLSHADLYSHLFTHEFLHKTSLQSMTVNPLLLPTPSLLPFAHLTQHQHNPNFNRNKVRFRSNWRPNSNRHSSQHRPDFHGFHPSAVIDWK